MSLLLIFRTTENKKKIRAIEEAFQNLKQKSLREVLKSRNIGDK